MSGSNNSMLIAVMGATGAGKTTFINLGSGSHMRIGYGLESCTSEVEISAPINLDGKIVTLIDTPGFDDTSKSEADILRLISDFLTVTYENGRKLNGVIFVHRISDKRMGGVARKNFRLFRKLCGEDAMRNVIIVTNMWAAVTEEVGASREKELSESDLFFKPALEKGASMMRHDNTAASARRIIESFFGNRPKVLSIQREIVDEKKSISQTTAGQDLQAELEEQLSKHQKELQEVRAELEALMEQKDQSHQDEIKELNDALSDVKAHLAKVHGEYQKLHEESQEDRQGTKESAIRVVRELEEKEGHLRKSSEQTRLERKAQPDGPQRTYVEQDVPEVAVPKKVHQNPDLQMPANRHHEQVKPQRVIPQPATRVDDTNTLSPPLMSKSEPQKRSSWCIIF